VQIDGLTETVEYNGLDATNNELLSDGRVSFVLDHFNGKEIKLIGAMLLARRRKHQCIYDQKEPTFIRWGPRWYGKYFSEINLLNKSPLCGHTLQIIL
jgi:hypothetical protein